MMVGSALHGVGQGAGPRVAVDTGVVALTYSAFPVVALQGAVPLAASQGTGLPVVVDTGRPVAVDTELPVEVDTELFRSLDTGRPVAVDAQLPVVVGSALLGAVLQVPRWEPGPALYQM